MGKDQEYKEMFLAEAQESHAELNKLFTSLEKDISNKKAVDSIFRITHTLKGNAMGMGFTEIAELSHVMEDVFNEVKSGKLVLDEQIFSSLYKANDVLGELISAVAEPRPVKYKGIKTKLEVILKNIHRDAADESKKENEQTAVTTTHPELSGIEVKQPVSETIEKTEEKHVAESREESTPEQSTEQEEEEDAPKITISDVVQVPVRKLDSLLNIVGELLIEKDSLIARYTDKGYNASDFARLHRITSDLQYGVMDVRLVQVGFLFSKFHRIIRDVAVIENKKVNLVLEGTENEIDRNILKSISDSLVHLVRNSVSHGVESPEKRRAAGKPEEGVVTLRARNEKDTVYIEVSDDGAGINLDVIKRKAIEKGIISAEYAARITPDEIMMCLFEPGFSNAEKITEVSGRGVGMDVVKKATEAIGGKVYIRTELGKGSVFTLALPSSMAVKGALLFELDQQEFAIPLSYTEAVISLRKKDLHKVNNGLITTYLGHTISMLFLSDLYEMATGRENSGDRAMHRFYDRLSPDVKLEVVIVSYSNHHVGLIVDKLMQQKEIVEKALSSPVDNSMLFSGATILGNGNVCLVLDIASILSNLFREKISR